MSPTVANASVPRPAIAFDSSARRAIMNNATKATRAAATAEAPASVTCGRGKNSPRLFRSAAPNWRLSPTPGNSAIAEKYQKKICSSKGMLRNTST